MLTGLLLMCLGPLAWSPEDAVSVANFKLKDMAQEDRENTRFVSLYHIQDKETRRDYAKVISYVLNSLSSRRVVVVPKFVDADERLIQFDLRDYGISKGKWEYLKGEMYFKRPKKDNKQVEALTKLMKVTESEAAIVRGDWFIVTATTAPIYYRMMGLGNFDDFKKKTGYDEEGARKVGAQQRAVIMNSMVARNYRAVVRTATVTGYVYEVRDGDYDYVMEPLSDKASVICYIGSMTNGFHVFFMTDSKGGRLDQHDVAMAIDNNFTDKVMRTSRSCVGCHAKGIQPFECGIRKLLKGSEIKLKNKKDAERLRDLYDGEIPVAKDQERYAEAVQKATGWSGEDFSKKFVAFCEKYHVPLDRQDVLAELGITSDELDDMIKSSVDPHLIGLTKGIKMRRDYFEEWLKVKKEK